MEELRPAVADIIDGCTDADTDPKPPRRQRKEAYIAHIAKVPAPVRLVSNADKLHTLRTHGASLWGRFTAGNEGSLWYYRSLVGAFVSQVRSPLVDELDRTVGEIEALATAT